MKNFLDIINKKLNSIYWALIINGVILLLLGVLIVWTDFLLRLLVGMIAILVAYVFFHMAHKMHSFKREFEKYRKMLS